MMWRDHRLVLSLVPTLGFVILAARRLRRNPHLGCCTLRVTFKGQHPRDARLILLTSEGGELAGNAVLRALIEAGFDCVGGVEEPSHSRWRPLWYDATRGGWSPIVPSSLLCCGGEGELSIVLEDAARSAHWAAVSAPTEGYFGIGILQGKTEGNQGTIWRSAFQFGAAFVFTIGARDHQLLAITNSALYSPRPTPTARYYWNLYTATD